MKSSFLSTVLRQPGANHHSPCSLVTSSRYVTHVGTQKLSEFWFMYCISVMTVTQQKLQCFAQEWRTFRHQCFKLVFLVSSHFYSGIAWHGWWHLLPVTPPLIIFAASWHALYVWEIRRSHMNAWKRNLHIQGFPIYFLNHQKPLFRYLGFGIFLMESWNNLHRKKTLTGINSNYKHDCQVEQ